MAEMAKAADADAVVGLRFDSGPDWQPFAVQDGLLITGQNPQSATKVGEEMARLLTSS